MRWPHGRDAGPSPVGMALPRLAKTGRRDTWTERAGRLRHLEVSLTWAEAAHRHRFRQANGPSGVTPTASTGSAGRLADTGEFATQRHLAEAHPGQPEPGKHAAWAAVDHVPAAQPYAAGVPG